MKPVKALFIVTILSIVIFTQCTSDPQPIQQHKIVRKDSTKKKPDVDTPATAFHYHFISLKGKGKAKDSLLAIFKSLTPGERNIILRLNRVDAASYRRLDTMVVPDKIDTNWMAYSVFPYELPVLKDVRKMVFFAYYAEAFAAYENGKLVRWGPTNMGKKASPTPTGLFSANWKAKETISTVNDEWKLKWNFNVWNKGGVGWHEYQLPGYPASHSCMRLLEADALYLYNWADQWVLSKGELAAQGTPVLIFGEYPFGHGKPWWKLVESPTALNVPADTLAALVQPHLDKILKRQAQRDSVIRNMPKVKTDTAAVKPTQNT